MNEQDFHRRWRDRSSRYLGGNDTDADLPIHLSVDADYAATYSGQVAAITAASLFGRMSRRVAVNAPSLPIVAPLPWRGQRLDEFMMRTLKGAHKYGEYAQRAPTSSDIRLSIGPHGDGLVMHGSGWGAYRGPGPSPLKPSDEPNPFGAAFAVVDAAAQIQQRLDGSAVSPLTLDTYRWAEGAPSAQTPLMQPEFELGELWTIGVGSVGSSALFFLSLITRNFRAVLVDRDLTEIENITRSALFSWQDAVDALPKAEVAARWLRETGVELVDARVAWLHETLELWTGRTLGTPDLLISAANEYNVRSIIESAYPPLQVYATTGRNWQATLFRHVPLVDACSRCVPGSRVTPMPAPCATGTAMTEDGSSEDDIALPFLSFAAGVMTSAEIAKIALTGRTVSPNQVVYAPRGQQLIGVQLAQDTNCPCHARDMSHSATIRGSLFEALSGTP